MSAEDRAVVVGVTRYPALGDLGGPENDANDFEEWLLAPDGGDVPRANIAKILSSDWERSDDPLTAEPTTVRLERAFDELQDLGEAQSGRVGNRLYIYMAGHGFAPQTTEEDAALLMANAARGRSGHHIPGRPYAEWFRRAAFFREVVLFMDCCRENNARAPMRVPPYDIKRSQRPGRAFYGFATDWDRASREGPFGPNKEVRGIFTLALLAGLRDGAPRNEAGELTGSLLHDFVHNYVRERLSQDGTTEDLQEPQFQYNPKKDVIFRSAAAPRAGLPKWRLRVTIPPGPAGRIVELLNGSLQILPATRATGDQWEWDGLAPGLYRVRAAAGASQFVELIGEPGERHVQL